MGRIDIDSARGVIVNVVVVIVSSLSLVMFIGVLWLILGGVIVGVLYEYYGMINYDVFFDVFLWVNGIL